MRRFLAACLLASSCASSSARDEESADPPTRCERMRDHLVEIRLADAAGVDRAAHREALRNALGAEFMSACGAMTIMRVDCVLDAEDSSALAACTSKH